MNRIEVLKTYKLYIGGKFPRTESGRYFQPLRGLVLFHQGSDQELVAGMALP